MRAYHLCPFNAKKGKIEMSVKLSPGSPTHGTSRQNPFHTTNAIDCKLRIGELLRIPTPANIDTAAKVLKYAVKRCYFTPMSCSIRSGLEIENQGTICSQMIASARAELDKSSAPGLEQN